MTKPPLFQPAPRPKPHTSVDAAQKLSEAAGDLGFTRASNAPEGQEPEGSNIQVGERSKGQEGKNPLAQKSQRIGLKLEIPDAVYTALRQEALNRRVTVRYLVLEALAAKGYAVDLSAVPEDGRRIR